MGGKGARGRAQGVFLWSGRGTNWPWSAGGVSLELPVGGSLEPHAFEGASDFKVRVPACPAGAAVFDVAISAVPSGEAASDPPSLEIALFDDEPHGALTLGGETFESARAVRKRVGEILRRATLDQRLPPPEEAVVRDLLSFHPEAGRKMRGMDGIKKAISEEHPGTECFWICRGGEGEDFSYNKCVDCLMRKPEAPMQRSSATCVRALLLALHVHRHAGQWRFQCDERGLQQRPMGDQRKYTFASAPQLTCAAEGGTLQLTAYDGTTLLRCDRLASCASGRPLLMQLRLRGVRLVMRSARSPWAAAAAAGRDGEPGPLTAPAASLAARGPSDLEDALEPLDTAPRAAGEEDDVGDAAVLSQLASHLCDEGALAALRARSSEELAGRLACEQQENFRLRRQHEAATADAANECEALRGRVAELESQLLAAAPRERRPEHRCPGRAGDGESREAAAHRQAVETDFDGEELLEDIRRERLLDPSNLPEHCRQAFQNMQRSLQASMGQFSLGLYSQRDRFLLECVQNADDCKFGDSVEVPQLQIMCRPGEYFWMQWNEQGFQPEDVRAVCDIARSTKRYSAHVATGCKGLGFKSYFLVSDTPHVLSRPFLFRFDAAAEVPLPELTPWRLSEEECRALPLEVPDSGTAVYLPVRDRMASSLGAPRLPPVVMLFLRRLRQVSIRDDASPSVHETRLYLPRSFSAIEDKREEFDGGLEVSVQVTTVEGDGPAKYTDQRFILFRSVTADGVVEAAFPRRRFGPPTAPDGGAAPEAQTAAARELEGPSALPLCVTLPVADLGFAFAINGDFELVASREEVDRSSTKNLSLRRALATLWLKAVGETPELRAGLWDLLPASVSNPFWAPFVADISKAVHDWAVLPTSTEGTPLPASHVLRHSRLSQVLELSGHRLRGTLGMDFLADDFCPRLDTRRECKPFDLTHLLRYLEADGFDPASHGEMWRARLVRELLRAFEGDLAELPLPLQDAITRLRRVGLFRLCGSSEADWAPADGGADAGRIFTRCASWRPAGLRVLSCAGEGGADVRLLESWLGGGGDAGPRDVASAALLHSAAPRPTDVGTLLFLRDHWLDILQGSGSNENRLTHMSADDVALRIAGAVWLSASEGPAMRPSELILPLALGQALPEDASGSRVPRAAVPATRPRERSGQGGLSVQESLSWELLLLRLGSRLPRGGGGGGDRPVDVSRVLAGEETAEPLAAEVLEAHRGCGGEAALREHVSVVCLGGGEARLTETSPHVFAEAAFYDFAGTVPLVTVSARLCGPAEAVLGIRCSRDAATAATCLLPSLVRRPQPAGAAAFRSAYAIIANADGAELQAPLADRSAPGANGADRTVAEHLRGQLYLPFCKGPLMADACVWQSCFEASASLSGWAVLEPLFGDSENLRALFVDKLGVALQLSARNALRVLQAFATEDGRQGGCYTSGSLPWIRTDSVGYLMDLERALEHEGPESIAAEEFSVPFLTTAAQWIWCGIAARREAQAECILVEDASSAAALEVATAAAKSVADPVQVRVITANIRECPRVTNLLNLVPAGDALKFWLSSDPATLAKRCFPEGWTEADSLMTTLPESSHEACGLAGVTSISIVDGLSLSIRLPVGGGEVQARWSPGGVVVYGTAMLICRGCLAAQQLQACVARTLAALIPEGAHSEDARRELARALRPQNLRDATASAFPHEVPAEAFLSDLSGRGEKPACLLRSSLAMMSASFAEASTGWEAMRGCGASGPRGEASAGQGSSRFGGAASASARQVTPPRRGPASGAPWRSGGAAGSGAPQPDRPRGDGGAGQRALSAPGGSPTDQREGQSEACWRDSGAAVGSGGDGASARAVGGGRGGAGSGAGRAGARAETPFCDDASGSDDELEDDGAEPAVGPGQAPAGQQDLRMLARTIRRIYREHSGFEVIEAWRERLQRGTAHAPPPEAVDLLGTPHEFARLRVGEVRFTHASVASRFRHGPHRGQEIVSLAAALESGEATVDDVPLVCVRLGDATYSLFNRRLYGLREYASRRPGEDVRVPALVFKADPLTAKFVLSFTSQCEGAQAVLRGR